MFIRSAIGLHIKPRAIPQSTVIVMRIPALVVLCAALTRAQVPSISNTDFPTFRANLNASLGNAVSITGSYSNPSWITTLAFAKITGVPSFEVPLTFSAPLVRTTNTISCPTCGGGGGGATPGGSTGPYQYDNAL